MVTAAEAKMISERYQKAVELVEQGRVFPVYDQPGLYAVINGEGKAYLVNVDTPRCNCPDYTHRTSKRDLPCKHILAAQLFAERGNGGNGDDGGAGGRRRRYRCDRGHEIEDDQERTGTRCSLCTMMGLVGYLEPVAEPERCPDCGDVLDADGVCWTCHDTLAYAELVDSVR
jgi:hypothetical protein